MIRRLKNTLAVLGAVCFVIGMQGFALGGFSGQASVDSSRISSLGVDPLQNALFLLAGWGLLGAARRVSCPRSSPRRRET
ncbi:MAG: hypothetical protein ACRDK3_07430 [Actinomycetota bacterium]